MSFAVGLLTTVALFAVGGVAAGWLFSRLQLLSVGHALVAGTGAYVFAVASRSGAAPVSALLLAAASGGVTGVLIVLASRRVVSEEFALFSFAGQVAWLGLVTNAREWTGGPLGLARIEGLPLFSVLGRPVATLLWAGLSLTAAWIVLAWERQAWFPVSAAVVARSGELADSLGIRSNLVRLQVGGLYGLLLGTMGALLAAYLTFISPELFSVMASVVLLAIGFLAAWRWWAAAMGAALLVGVPDLLRLAGLAATETSFLRQLLSGVVVALGAFLTMWRRRE